MGAIRLVPAQAHQKFNKIPLNYKMKTIHFSCFPYFRFPSMRLHFVSLSRSIYCRFAVISNKVLKSFWLINVESDIYRNIL